MMDKERFSLLLLEPNEIYFEDFSVNLIFGEDANNDDGQWQSTDDQPINGHLKMCSKSIVFDPKNVALPIIKIAYKNCDKISIWPGKWDTNETNVLAISCSQYTEMLPKNVVAPYSFRMERRVFLFNFHYAKVEEYIDQVQQLHRASDLHAIEQNDMIATIVYSRHKRVKFNPLWLDNIFYEAVLIDHTVDEINPLVSNPGRLLLSTKRIYFQPYNNVQPYPVIKINLESVNCLMKRRFLLRQIGMEINWTEDGKENVLYVSFRNQSERDEFYDRIMEQERISIPDTEPESMTLKWQNGVISNYDYLLYLNSLADRTFQDLTQYPVFPWIISDYQSNEIDLNDPKYYRDLSKPIGALNEDRLAKLKERYEEMDEPKFMYGSHFSAPGLVLFYLVRKFPKLMLCLQNGHFDHPDRMFNRVSDAFNNCLSNMSDFKELIPEFYDIEQKGDFLVNKAKINFGKRFNGTPVNNVQLPPWANDSPEKFVQILRDALESDYVSKNLHHWIDLIFGYKQRGDEALKANNLFFHLCYEGAIDLENINDLAKRHALEVQISEFGQIPKQLFTKPHVQKIVPKPMQMRKLSSVDTESFAEDETDTNSEHLSENTYQTLTYLATYQTHKNLICFVLTDGKMVISTGKDGLLKCYNMEEKRQIRSVPIGNLPISSCIKIPNTNSFILGSWDNTIIIYDLDYGRRLNEIPAHDDAVSCLSYINDGGILISGSWDCSVKIWKGFDNKSYRLSDSMLSYLSLEEKIVAIDSRRIKNKIKVVIGLVSGEVMLWTSTIDDGSDLNNVTTVDTKTLLCHDDEVTDVTFNRDGTKLASCGLDKSLFVCDIQTGMILFKNEHSNCLICLNWCFSNQMLYLGDNIGMIHVWNMMTGEKNCFEKIFNGPVTAVASTVDEDNNCVNVIAAGVDHNEFMVTSWRNV